jgi:hypothetical protein
MTWQKTAIKKAKYRTVFAPKTSDIEKNEVSLLSE